MEAGEWAEALTAFSSRTWETSVSSAGSLAAWSCHSYSPQGFGGPRKCSPDYSWSRLVQAWRSLCNVDMNDSSLPSWVRLNYGNK